MRFFVLILPFLLFTICTLCTAADTTAIRHYNMDNGLPANKVYFSMQDKQGYIWFATENGVVKYDGYTFKVFNERNGLPSSDVWRLSEDNFGRIWLSCYANSLGYIKNDKYYSVGPKYNSPVRLNYIRSSDNSTILVSYRDRKYNILRVNADNSYSLIKQLDDIWILYLATDNSIYYLHERDRVIRQLRYTGHNFSINKLCVLDTNMLKWGMPYYNAGTKIYGLAEGSQIIKTKSKITCKEDTVSLKRITGYPDEVALMYEPFYDSLQIFGKYGTYFLSDNLQLKKVLKYSNYFDTIPSIVYNIEDINSNKWFMTSEGVYLAYNKLASLSANRILQGGTDITLIGQLSNGSVCWWNNKQLQLIIVDSTNSKIERINLPSKLLSLTEIDNNRLLCCFTQELSIMELDLRTKSLQYPFSKKIIWFESAKIVDYASDLDMKTRIGNKAKILSGYEHAFFSWIKAIDKVTEGEYIIRFGTFVGNIKENKNTVAISYNYYNKFLKHNIDNNKRTCYYYDNNKILVHDIANNNYKILSDTLLQRLGINNIRAITTDRFNNIFIQTNDHILLFNPVNRVFKKLTSKLNLAATKMLIYKDHLVLAGPQALCYAKISGEGKIGAFYLCPVIVKEAYSIVYDFVINTCGVAYLNTNKGLFNIRYDSLIQTGKAILQDDLQILTLSASHPYSKNIRNNDTLLLSKEDNIVRLNAINFYGKGERKYRYRINGYSQWIESNTGEIFLPSLKPERYYEVQCSVSDDWWSSDFNKFYLYKEPYWWQSSKYVRIFWVAGVLLFGLLVFGIVITTRYYVNKTNEKKSRLLDLELRALYSQINPHFIFNTLSSALFFINKQNFDEAYNHVSKFSKLLRSYLNSSQERYVTLAHEIGMLRNYIELQQIRFEEKFDYDITVDNKIPVDNIKIPSLLLQPLVENAINHGLFHLKQKGRLLISFRQGKNSNEMVCTIDDNGIGRQRAAEIKKESTTQYTSYGTKLTRKLIDIFSEYEHMNIYLEYIDKQLPDRGTTVQLTIRNLKYDA